VHVFGRILGDGDPVGVLGARRGRERIDVRGRPAPPSASGTEDHGFVSGIWAIARVRELLAKRRGVKLGDRDKKEIIELSKRHGILTRYTALLAK
jgi:hypothetical protein